VFTIFGGIGVQGKNLEAEFFVDHIAFLLTGGGQEIVGHVHQQAQVAGGVFTESLNRGRADDFKPIVLAILIHLTAFA
jgi:hypothetical protein